MRFLVTAGNTRERIDSVRDWGNIFTGNTGLSIACAVAAVGEVDLLSSNVSHLTDVSATAIPNPLNGHRFRAHADLKRLLSELMNRHRYDAVFMSAAVADYRPVRVYAVVDRSENHEPGQQQWIVKDVQAGKIKSTHSHIAVLGEQTEKLVDLFRTEWQHDGLLVKFKLEVGLSPNELIEIGQQSRKSSGAEYLVANTLDMLEGEDPGAFLLSDAGAEWVPRAQLPQRMLALVTALA